MRILLLANNWTAWQIASWLRDQGEKIVGLVVHPTSKAKFRDEIIEATGICSDRVIDGSALREPLVLSRVKAMNPDIGVSVFFGYILRSEFLELFPRGVVNLHSS